MVEISSKNLMMTFVGICLGVTLMVAGIVGAVQRRK